MAEFRCFGGRPDHFDDGLILNLTQRVDIQHIESGNRKLCRLWATDAGAGLQQVPKSGSLSFRLRNMVGGGASDLLPSHRRRDFSMADRVPRAPAPAHVAVKTQQWGFSCAESSGTSIEWAEAANLESADLAKARRGGPHYISLPRAVSVL